MSIVTIMTSSNEFIAQFSTEFSIAISTGFDMAFSIHSRVYILYPRLCYPVEIISIQPPAEEIGAKRLIHFCFIIRQRYIYIHLREFFYAVDLFKLLLSHLRQFGKALLDQFQDHLSCYPYLTSGFAFRPDLLNALVFLPLSIIHRLLLPPANVLAGQLITERPARRRLVRGGDKLTEQLSQFLGAIELCNPLLC